MLLVLHGGHARIHDLGPAHDGGHPRRGDGGRGRRQDQDDHPAHGAGVPAGRADGGARPARVCSRPLAGSWRISRTGPASCSFLVSMWFMLSSMWTYYRKYRHVLFDRAGGMKLAQPIWPRFLPSSLVLAIATLGPLGRRRRAPGTWGSAAGLLYFTVFFWPLGFWPWSALWTLLFSLPGLYLAVAMCGEAEFRLGRRDPRGGDSGRGHGDAAVFSGVARPAAGPRASGSRGRSFSRASRSSACSTSRSRSASANCRTCPAAGASWWMTWRRPWRRARCSTGRRGPGRRYEGLAGDAGPADR